MKRMLQVLPFVLLLLIWSCGGGNSPDSGNADQGGGEKPKSMLGGDASDYDPNRGEGKFTTVELGASLDATMADSGEKIYQVKCAACHKLTEEKLVGPGWKGVTQRKKPEWIMNFITNPDPMLNKDPELIAQLEICLVRMPNQNLTDDDARHALEFMRENDGVK